ncbi:bifunctional proline dehydrogenase/L-glutamate gamma-semialdehyde dehydrogenase PutA, partial [Kingella kingae]|nr:bifunctional proline dehydrogenase/L-glutamate gamma-semialdehyde dehydrogenase PutA [Kingella kingae]
VYKRQQSLSVSHAKKVKLGGVLGESRMHTLNNATALLKSVTGERNELTWRAPKQVYVEGGTLDCALEAFVRIAATGAQVVVAQSHPLSQIATLAGSLIKVSAYPEQEPHVAHLVVLDAPSIALKVELAQRNGAIIRIIDASAGVDVLPLYEEISCSINTTAAGGNASLMAMAEA